VELQIALNQHLSRELFVAMKRCVSKCSTLPEIYLFAACRKHIKDARVASYTNPRVNLPVAEAIAQAFLALEDSWAELSENQQIGLKAAMYYFALDEDGAPDFATTCGFDDDLEVANVCLVFSGKEGVEV